MRQFLIYILLNIVNSIGYDKSSKEIAKKLLLDLDFVKNASLEECANKFEISVSTLNRFCRKIGMYNYTSLREAANHYTPEDEEISFFTPKDPNKDLDVLIPYMKELDEKVDFETILTYCQNAQTIYYRGFDYHFTFLHFQQGMMILDKYVEIWNPDSFSYAGDEKKEDLILVFSMDGNNLRRILPKLQRMDCKRLCITQVQDNRLDQYFDCVVHIPPAPNYACRRMAKERILEQILYLFKNKKEQQKDV